MDKSGTKGTAWKISTCTVVLGFFACSACRILSTQSGVVSAYELSREETVALLFMQGLPHEFFESANPAAKQEIYAISDGLRAYSTNAVRLMGYIGGDEDVEVLERYLLALRWDECDGRGASSDLNNAMQALGRIAMRGSNLAVEAIAEMSEKEFWESANLVVYPPSIMKACPDRKYMGFIFAYYLRHRLQGETLPDVSAMIDAYFPETTGEQRAILSSDAYVARKVAADLLQTGQRRRLRREGLRRTLTTIYDTYQKERMRVDGVSGAFVGVQP